MNPTTFASSDIAVDHVIFNAGFAVDLLGEFFQALGFTLTPLGRHSTGSINRLVILPGVYVELIGFEVGTSSVSRPDLRRLPLGLTGIALRDKGNNSPTDSLRPGFNAPFELKRPVELAGLQSEARFRITTLRETPVDFRVFMCRHYTPELVWRAEWQWHPNRASGLRWVRVQSLQPKALHAALQTALAIDGPAPVAQYRAGAMCIEMQTVGHRPALAFETDDLPGLAARLEANDLAHVIGADGALTVPLPAEFDAELVFVGAR